MNKLYRVSFRWSNYKSIPKSMVIMADSKEDAAARATDMCNRMTSNAEGHTGQNHLGHPVNMIVRFERWA